MLQVMTHPYRPPRRLSLGAARRRRLRAAYVAALLLLVAQLVLPLQVHAAAAEGAADGPVPLTLEQLNSITGGCSGGCKGDDDEDEGDEPPDKIGRPYWEYSHRTLISRTQPAGDLVWYQKNSTNQSLGPIRVSYESRESLNWSISGGVPSGVVKADVGAQHSRSFTVSAEYTIPPRTYYKLFVAYPTERHRHYYKMWQDYDDNSRDQVGSGSVTSTKQYTLTNLVPGPVY